MVTMAVPAVPPLPPLVYLALNAALFWILASGTARLLARRRQDRPAKGPRK